MKIGIITLLGNNYGNRLQNYAVQELLTEYGDVYTVKYEKKTPVVVKKNSFERYSLAHIKIAANSRLLNIYHLSNRKMNTFTRLVYFFKHKNEIKTAMARPIIIDTERIQFTDVIWPIVMFHPQDGSTLSLILSRIIVIKIRPKPIGIPI